MTRNLHFIFRKFLQLSLVVSVCYATLHAQFGGRQGDVVIYALTTKGNMDFETVPPTTTNPPQVASRFKSLYAYNGEIESPGDDFPMLDIIFLHRDPDDVFQLIVQSDEAAAPHHLYLTTFKIFNLKGIRRDFGYSYEEPRDFTVNGYTTFLKFADLGPNLSLGGDLIVLGWSPSDIRPPLILTPPDTPGPAVLNGKTGTELIVDLAVLPPLQPWTPLFRKYANAGWPDGIDLKFIEDDRVHGNVTQIIRLRPGKRTPPFRIDGNTHLYVLEGSVELTPMGGGAPLVLSPDHYAYVPDGFSFRLFNPKRYGGPQPGGEGQR